MAMDSKAVFAQRIGELGLAAFTNDFIAKGWDTHGNFAFASTYVPGSADDNRFVAQVVLPLLAAADHVKVTAVRRLFYESYTIMVADLKHRIERTDEEPARKLPNAERTARGLALQARLGPGVQVCDENECSHALVDRLVQIYDENVLTYVDWSTCTSRLEELSGVRHVKELKTDAAGYVKERVHEVRGSTDTSTDLLIRFALTRRGLAMELGQVLSYTAHEQLVAFLFREYLRLPPPGYSSVSIDQVRRADVEVFRQMQEQTRAGIKILPDGRMPLDLVLPGILVSPRVAMLLMPLPAAVGNKRGTPHGDNEAPSRLTKKQKAGKAKAKAEAAAKGKGKDGGKSPTMPSELRGMSSVYGDKRICFAFNMKSGCKEASTVEVGAKCSRGFHICCVPDCGGSHAKHDHR
jgi:hypothetical protein